MIHRRKYHVILTFMISSAAIGLFSCTSQSKIIDSKSSSNDNWYESPKGDFTFILPDGWISSFINQDTTMIVFHDHTVDMRTSEMIHFYRTPADSISFQKYHDQHIQKLKDRLNNFVEIDTFSVSINNRTIFRRNYGYNITEVRRTTQEYHFNGENGFYYLFTASCDSTSDSPIILRKLFESIKTVQIK